MKNEILEGCYGAKSAGHFGRNKTLSRLKQRFIWKGLQLDTILHIRNCDVCNRNKKPNLKAKAALGQFHSGVPVERIHMDILGPLVESKNKNKYILVIIDQFTKWIEFFPLPDQSAETIAKTAVDGFISRFGCPIQIHTDQGKNFTGNLFIELCKLLEIAKTRTTPYRP